jgi:hypothetical protein
MNELSYAMILQFNFCVFEHIYFKQITVLNNPVMTNFLMGYLKVWQ